MLGEETDGAREGVDGIGESVIAPAMAAGAGDADVEAAAGQGLRRDVVGVRSVEDQERLNAAAGTRLAAEVAHAAEIAFAFFADVGDEDQTVEEIGIVERTDDAGDGEECGESGAVVGD